MVAPTNKAKPAANKKGGKDDKSVDETFDPIRVDARLANTAVLMLDSPEDEVLQKACDSIFKFCEKSDNNKLMVHELGATGKLFNLMSHEERVIVRNATMAFGILSGHSEVRKFLRQNPQIIDKIISYLSPEYDPLTNEYAALWLKNMSEDYSTKTVLASNQEAVTNLINMLSGNDPDAVYNSVSTIDKLVADYQPRQTIRELKGIEPVLNLIQSEFPQIQEAAFSALARITQNAENRVELREMGGLEKLVDFLATPEQKNMHIHCLNVLANCLEDTQCLDLIQQTGGLTKILAYCQDLSESTELTAAQVNAAAARALARSARKPENRKILSEQYAEKMLIFLLMSDNDETKSAAAYAISIMAESTFSQDAIRNYEGIETLVRMLTSDNPKVREFSCLALSNLTYRNTNNCRNILSFMGIEYIVGLLKDEKDTTKAYACICLVNTSADEIIREEVARSGFSQSIISALSSHNTLTQAKACLAVSAYCVDALVRYELKLYGVVSLLVELIKSNNDEVRCNACWALTCSASDFNIAVEFCKAGAIETLRDVNMSSQRKSSFTEAALNRLLEANLSAKYALKNSLDPTDAVLDGFYDMGPMRPNGKFHTLDDLSKIPINDKRPVIIVYAPEEKPLTPTEGRHETTHKSKSPVKSGSATSNKSARDRDNSKDSKEKSSKAKPGKEKPEAKKSASAQKAAAAAAATSEQQHQQQHDTNMNLSATNISAMMLEEQSKLKDLTAFGADIYKPQFDKDLKLYIDQVRDLYQTLPCGEQAVHLARFVSDKLGGPVSRDEVNNLGYELLINETKYDLRSNIVPIGKIRLGTFYHRALLFKVLADKLLLRVTLERGDYNRAWNTIALKDERQNAIRYFIVDLIHEPGKFMEVNSLNAVQYVKL